MDPRSYMVPASITIPGTTGSTTRGPGPGVSMSAITPGPAGPSAMAMALAGSISVLASMVAGAAGPAAVGGVPPSIVLSMPGTGTGAMASMARTTIATGTSTSTTTTRIFTPAAAE